MEQPINPQPTQPNEPTKAKWYQKPLILGALGTLIIAAIAIAVYWPTNYQPVSTNQPEPILPAGKNWNVYNNSKYGFQVLYPDTLIESNNVPANDEDRNLECFRSMNGKGGSFCILLHPTELIKNRIQGMHRIIDAKDLIETEIDGKPAYYYKDGDAGCFGTSYRIYLDKSQHLEMWFVDCGHEPFIEPEIEKIVSTFNFIDTSPEPSNSSNSGVPGWKNYNLPETLVRFSYPPDWSLLNKDSNDVVVTSKTSNEKISIFFKGYDSLTQGGNVDYEAEQERLMNEYIKSFGKVQNEIDIPERRGKQFQVIQNSSVEVHNIFYVGTIFIDVYSTTVNSNYQKVLDSVRYSGF
jgi:hypothetical protein